MSRERIARAALILECCKYHRGGALMPLLRDMGADADVGALLWEGFEHDQIDVVESPEAWDWLAAAPSRPTAAVLLRFLHRVAEKYPDEQDPKVQRAVTQSWKSLGMIESIDTIIRARADDDAFCEVLIDGLSQIEPPYRDGLVYSLLQAGQTLPNELTGQLIKAQALASLTQSANPPSFVSREQWGSAQAQMLGKVEKLRTGSPFPDLLAQASVERLAEMTVKVPTGFSGPSLVEHLLAYGEAALDPLDAALDMADAMDKPSNGRNWPGVMTLFCWLHVLKGLGRPVPEARDAQIATILTHLYGSWTWSQDNGMPWVQEALRAIPLKRRTDLILGIPEADWRLYGAAPSAAILERITVRLSALPRYDSAYGEARSYADDVFQKLVGRPIKGQQGKFSGGALLALSKPLIPYLNAALRRGEPHHAITMVGLLAHTEDPAAIPGLIAALTHEQESRGEHLSAVDIALIGLVKLPTAQVAPQLKPIRSHLEACMAQPHWRSLGRATQLLTRIDVGG
ncbi:MAG: hypothetical protein AAFV53_41890 [Myxococcota bacterium]